MIAVLGSLNMDFVVRAERLPAPGETILGHTFQTLPGGKGANQACAAGKLAAPGAAVRMIGCTGYDIFGDQLRASLSAAGVDVSAVRSTRSAPTGIAMIWVDSAGQNSIIVAPGSNHALHARDAESFRPAFRGARHALFQLETPLDTVEAAMRIASSEGAQVILDPAPAQPLPASLLARVSILTPNEGEALTLLGRSASRVSLDEAPELAAALLSLGPRAVILKLGDHGCFYRDSAKSRHAPAFRVDAVDTTAAGDTFNAALAVALSEECAIEDALRFANAAAAISVTRPGAQTSAPSRSEVDALLI
ncbi:MAG: ribokinase [Bryobacteraceae bacterium]